MACKLPYHYCKPQCLTGGERKKKKIVSAIEEDGDGMGAGEQAEGKMGHWLREVDTV